MAVDFSHFTYPLLPAEFMTEYRGKKPVYFPGKSDKYVSLFSVEDLNQILSRTILAQGTVRIRKPEGGQLSLDEISTPVDLNKDRRAIRPGVIENHLKVGATLTVEHCESFFPSVHAMCCTLAEAFLARVYATVFLVYDAERPCGLHWDDRDMFVCQMIGRKKWPVYTPHYANPFFDQRRVTYKTPTTPLFQEFDLEAGDGLYIPRGWPHNPAAIEGSSMHIAFAIATPTGLDLLDWVRADLKDRCAEMRADLPIPLSTSEQQEYAREFRDVVMRYLSDEAIGDYYQQHKMAISPMRVNLPDIAACNAVIS